MEMLEERVAFLEGRGMEHSRMIDGVREAVINLELRIDRRFELLERRLTALESKFEFKFDQLVGRVDQRFAWLVGIQVTTLLAVAAGMAALLAR